MMWFIDVAELFSICMAVYIACFLIILPSAYGIKDLESGAVGEDVKRKVTVMAAVCFILWVLSVGIFSKLNSDKIITAGVKGYTTYFKGYEVESVSPKDMALSRIIVDEHLKTIEVEPIVK